MAYLYLGSIECRAALQLCPAGRVTLRHTVQHCGTQQGYTVTLLPTTLEPAGCSTAQPWQGRPSEGTDGSTPGVTMGCSPGIESVRHWQIILHAGPAICWQVLEAGRLCYACHGCAVLCAVSWCAGTSAFLRLLRTKQEVAERKADQAGNLQQVCEPAQRESIHTFVMHQDQCHEVTVGGICLFTTG